MDESHGGGDGAASVARKQVHFHELTPIEVGSGLGLIGAYNYLLRLLGVSAGSSSGLPLFATHFLKYSSRSFAVPLLLPAAGLPICRGGNALAAAVSQARATSTAMADTGPVPAAADSRTATSPIGARSI